MAGIRTMAAALLAAAVALPTAHLSAFADEATGLYGPPATVPCDQPSDSCPWLQSAAQSIIRMLETFGDAGPSGDADGEAYAAAMVDVAVAQARTGHVDAARATFATLLNARGSDPQRYLFTYIVTAAGQGQIEAGFLDDASSTLALLPARERVRSGLAELALAYDDAGRPEMVPAVLDVAIQAFDDLMQRSGYAGAIDPTMMSRLATAIVRVGSEAHIDWLAKTYAAISAEPDRYLRWALLQTADYPFDPLVTEDLILAGRDDAANAIAAMPADPLVRSPALAGIAAGLVVRGDTEQGAGLLDEALAIVAAVAPDRPWQRSEAWLHIGVMQARAGLADAAAATLAEAILAAQERDRLLDRIGQLLRLAPWFYRAGHASLGDEAIRQVEVLIATDDGAEFADSSRNAIVRALLVAGRPAEAEGLMQQSDRWWGSVIMEAEIATAYAQLGQWDHAERLMEAALQPAQDKPPYAGSLISLLSRLASAQAELAVLSTETP